jgi:drug/metabolite transporter (DMT)-like permease
MEVIILQPVIKYSIVVAGILTSAFAQIVLKKAAHYDIRSMYWCWHICISGLFYFVSFFLYSFALRVFLISKLSPIMTTGVMILVVVFGFVLGERLNYMQYLGILFGLLSIFLILS